MQDGADIQSTAESMSVAIGDETIAALHRNWVFGWERNVGDPPFSFRQTFGPYYEWDSAGVILYDDFDPEHRVARSATEYGAIWEPNFHALRTVHHRVADGPHVVRSGALAASTLVFVARIEAVDGAVTGIRTTTSLVWRRTDDGWRIVREHNSTVVVPSEEIDAAMDGGARPTPASAGSSAAPSPRRSSQSTPTTSRGSARS